MQDRSFWCWAAVVQMVRRHLELPERAQCEIAGARLKRQCCPPSEICNVAHRMDSFSDLLRDEGIASRGGGPPARPLEERELKDELFSDRPVIAGWIWDRDGSGHFVLVFGRPESGTKKPNKWFYWVADPNQGFHRVRYERLRDPPGGIWTWSWYNLRAAS